VYHSVYHVIFDKINFESTLCTITNDFLCLGSVKADTLSNY